MALSFIFSLVSVRYLKYRTLSNFVMARASITVEKNPQQLVLALCCNILYLVSIKLPLLEFTDSFCHEHDII